MMKPNFYNLVIVSPGDPRILKFHISRRAIIFLIVAFIVSFLVTVAFGYVMSSWQGWIDTEQSRLQSENQTLEVQNRNAAILNQKIEAQLDAIEKRSQRVNALIMESH